MYTALYALDRFRGRLCDGRLEGVAALSPETLAAARGDDLALLRLGVEWVKGLLEKSLPG